MLTEPAPAKHARIVAQRLQRMLDDLLKPQMLGVNQPVVLIHRQRGRHQ